MISRTEHYTGLWGTLFIVSVLSVTWGESTQFSVLFFLLLENVGKLYYAIIILFNS